jgi:hypothetical protein
MRINVFRFFCILICGVIFGPIPAVAFPYQPAEPLRVISQISADLNESGKPDVSFWRVVAEADQGEDEATLSFFNDMSDDRLCQLIVTGTGEIRNVDITGIPDNLVIRENDLLLVPGFPVPCNILPVQLMTGSQPSASKLYHVSRSSGSHVFADTLEVQAYPVTREAAQAKGWINSSLSTEQIGSLKVLKVVNQRNGDLVVLQLWETDADWWMYEKTLFRQSWRLK